jgi:hypothetical protein
MSNLLRKLNVRALSGNYIENGFMLGFTYEYFDSEGNEDKHLAMWLGLFVVMVHFN